MSDTFARVGRWLLNTWGGTVFSATIAAFVTFLFVYNADISVERKGQDWYFNINRYNSSEALKRYLKDVSEPEVLALKEEGYVDVTLVPKIYNDLASSGIQDCEEFKRISKDKIDCNDYDLVANYFNRSIRESYYYHVKDESLAEGVKELLEREDSVTQKLLALVLNGENPFGETAFKVAFDENIGFNDAIVCQDMRFWTTGNGRDQHEQLELRPPSPQDEAVLHTLKSVSNTANCSYGTGLDACFDGRNAKDFTEVEKMRNAPVKDRKNRTIGNNRYIKVSLEVAKRFFPEKFDNEGNALASFNSVNGEGLKEENILHFCELGFIRSTPTGGDQ